MWDVDRKRLEAVQRRRGRPPIRAITSYVQSWSKWVRSADLPRQRKVALALWNVLNKDERQVCRLGACSSSTAVVYVSDEIVHQELRSRLQRPWIGKTKELAVVGNVMVRFGLHGIPLADWCSDRL